jgi:hypothetical protein
MANMSDNIETLEDLLANFESMLSEDLSDHARTEYVDTFFAGLVAGVGIVGNRLADVEARGSISDFMQALAAVIGVTVSDIVQMKTLLDKPVGKNDVQG